MSKVSQETIEKMVVRFWTFCLAMILASFILAAYALWEVFGPLGWCV